MDEDKSSFLYLPSNVTSQRYISNTQKSQKLKKPKLQEEQKQKLLTIPKHSIRYALNERAKELRKNQI